MVEEFLFEERVMGCTFSVSLIESDRARATRTFAHMFQKAQEYEAEFSRFIPESTLSKLNREKYALVNREFLNVIGIGKILHERTAGVFNILNDISRFGYDADFSVIEGKNRTPRSTEHYSTDMQTLVVDTERSSIALGSTQAIDVGGFLKGYVAEHLARLAPEAQGVIVNIGGDIFARGSDADGEPFSFEIENPVRPLEPISFVTSGGGIATSGSYKRAWKLHGKPFFHILGKEGIDNPETDIVSATVCAPTGHEAEAFATTALVLGSEQAVPLLEEEGFSYALIHSDGTLTCSDSFAHTSYTYA